MGCETDNRVMLFAVSLTLLVIFVESQALFVNKESSRNIHQRDQASTLRNKGLPKNILHNAKSK